MDRRTFVTLAAAVSLAGCLGDDPSVDTLLETGESTSFEAEEGDEIEVTIAAGENGATATIEHRGDADRWEWTLGDEEEETETITIPADGEYVVTVEDGSAFILVE